ncbi:uncharacterized protein [Aquarana catesbeiana]|uniref:uncharacterized protein n=1 Tax=Aquarana catesbeiana TaxID=8400 RepID=UPI003CCA0C99
MPKCVVKACPHATGQKTAYPDISLHAFPRKIPQMQAWLRLAGMDEEMVKDFTKMILEDKRSDKFRMCSAHFTEDCYTMKGVRRALKEDSMPTIFPKEVPIFDETLDPWVRRNNRRARNEFLAMELYGERYRQRRCSCDCHRQSHLVDTATQTDAVFILAMVQQVPYTKLASHKSITMDHEYTRSTELGLAGSGPITTTQKTFIPHIEFRPAEDNQREMKSKQSEKIEADTPTVKNAGTSPSSYSNTEHGNFSNIHIKEEPLSDEEYPLDSSINGIQHPSTHIKEEPCEEELVPFEMDYTTVVVNDCPMSCEDITCPPHAEVSMPTHQVKEELLSDDENLPTSARQMWSTSSLKKKRLSEGHLMPPDTSTPDPQPQHTSKKQAVISDTRPRNNFSDSLPHLEGSQSSPTNRESMEITVTVNNCSKCEESFTSNEELLLHQRMYHQQKHMSIHSEPAQEMNPEAAVVADAKGVRRTPLFKCQYCGKVCKSLNFLSRHEEIHQNKTYTCSECGRCFTSSIGLTVHQKTHKVEKVVEYPKCRQAFLIDSNLILQQQVRTAQISIICFECGKVFEVKQSLKEHESLHEEKTIYRCSECQSRTKSSIDGRKPQLFRTAEDILLQRNGY